MKKLTILLMSFAMIAVFTSPSFAQLRKDLAIVKGSAVYINSSRTEISVKDVTTGKEVVFNHAGVPGEIMAGSQVVVIYKVGTKQATTVRLARGQKAAVAASMPSYQAPKAKAATAAATAPAATTTTAPAKPSKYGW